MFKTRVLPDDDHHCIRPFLDRETMLSVCSSLARRFFMKSPSEKQRGITVPNSQLKFEVSLVAHHITLVSWGCHPGYATSPRVLKENFLGAQLHIINLLQKSLTRAINEDSNLLIALCSSNGIYKYKKEQQNQRNFTST
eukprot:scaffold434_cov54-Cylindrotheca_fusiformis.AAC.1